jgi:scyllo-inositol 2-dehydrogenase (NADP+)
VSRKVVIIGLGVQGKKRLAVAGSDAAYIVDPMNPDAHFKDIQEVPLDSYSAAIVCTPNGAKFKILEYLLSNKKHLMVEKPLLAESNDGLSELSKLALKSRTTCYTAYNHRFEPHLVEAAEMIKSGSLGEIYTFRMFYGNGTARDARNSAWRDQGMGVFSDLGSHLLDLVHFILGQHLAGASVNSINTFENKSPDHFNVQGRVKNTLVTLEATMLSWRNSFSLDILAEKGSVHVDCLCKWGPSTLTFRERVLPSGRPPERAKILTQPDPTWRIEYQHFLELSKTGSSNIENDLAINTTLNDLWRSTYAK